MRVQNFKAWRDTGAIRLAPITVLFGNNSSGKSSLHQFLLMLRQTAESPDRRRVLHTGDSSTPVDLGGFADLTPNGDAAAVLEFSLSWDLPKALTIKDSKSNASWTGTAMTFSSRLAASDSAPPRLQVLDLRYTLSAPSSPVTIGLQRSLDGRYRITTDGFKAVRTLGRKWPVSQPSHFHAFPDDVQNRFQNLEFVNDLTLALERQLSSVAYLGPLRDRPVRLYRWSGEEPEHVGWRGERTVDALLAGRNRVFNVSRGAKRRPLQEVVAQWLETLGIISSFEVAPIGEGRDEYEVRVQTPGRAHTVNLTDVGFGVSQVLPVIVECFYAAPHSTLILEQPEIHLHPAVQAGLADLFIAAIGSREKGNARGLQLIVESHSEHFLRRLLRRIAEGEVAADQVALYFTTTTSDGSRLDPLELDDYGNIMNWPKDFFGDQAGDMLAQTRAARERRQADRHV